MNTDAGRADGPAPSRGTVQPYLWMLFGAFAFATMNAMAHATTCDWRVVGLARAGLMFVFAGIYALAIGVRILFLRPYTLWVRSLSGSASLLCTFYAIIHMPISDAITLMNMVPVWVTLLSWPVLKERPGARVWLAVAVSLAGVYLIAQPHFAEGRIAAAAALGSSLFTAIAVLGLHKLADVDPRAVVIHFAGASTLVTGAVFLAGDFVSALGALKEARNSLLLLGVGLTGTVGQIGLTRAFARGDPPRVAVVGLTQLLIVAVYDRILWQRAFTPQRVLGMVLVAAPTGWLLLRQAGRLLSRPSP